MIRVKNATLVEFDPPRVEPDTTIEIEGAAIRAVHRGGAGARPNGRSPGGGGARAAAGAGSAAPDPGPGAAGPERVIDAAGALVFPGLVCSHTHVYSGLARGIIAGIGDTPDFASILKKLWWRVDRATSEQSLYSSALVCALDAIRCGTTALIDHHASPSFISGSLSTLRRGFERVGVRASTCYEVTDRHGRADMSAGVEENARFAEELAGSAPTDGSPPLVTSHIGGHAPFTLPEEGLRALATAAEATDRGVHIHAGEDAFDVSHSHLHYGEDLIERLDRHGLITDKTIVVHGVYLSEADVRLINERGAFLVSNARSNMNNGVGYNPHLPRYANLALGTDGIDGNMFHEIKHAYFKHRDARGAMSPQDFLSALQAGNRLLERSFGGSFGRIAPGYAADLVIADYNPPTPLGAENLAGHVVFGMDSGATRTVIVGGRIVYEDGRFPFDTAEIYADARLEAEKLWKRVDEIQP